MIENLLLGFSTALSIENLFYCILGVSLGTFVGIVPGLGTLATLSILLPVTYAMSDPISALIMMAGIYYGSQYGGSNTAILLNLPGEISSVVMVRDGYGLTKLGYAGAALATAASGSVFAGIVATCFIAFFSPVLVNFALLFGPREYLALMFFGLVCGAIMGGQSIVRGLIMALVGVQLSMIGVDFNTGNVRLIFDNWNFADGVPLLPLVMGLYGLGEIIHYNLHSRHIQKQLANQYQIFTKETWKKVTTAFPSILRGTTLGSFIGLIPGTGATLSSFISYAFEKRIARDKSNFGKGDIRGVGGPESANNAGAQTSFIPMLSLGLPINPVMALLMSTMIVHDIQPGPSVITNNPDLFWGLIASMLIGNLLLLFINLSTVGLTIKLLRLPLWIITVFVFASCILGAYSLNHDWFDVQLLLIFGVVGYILKLHKFDVTPLLLGFMLGPKLEESLIQSLTIANGNALELLHSGIAVGLYILTVLVIVLFRKPVIVVQ